MQAILDHKHHAPAHRNRLPCLTLLLALLIGSVGSTSSVVEATQPDAEVAATSNIWDLVPADATGLIAINTDPDNPQWVKANEILESAGLADFAGSLVSDFLAETDISAANFIPGQSSILGGTIAAATWGDAEDPVRTGAVYIDAADPEAAFRSVAAQLITESGDDFIESEFNGGQGTYTLDESGAILLIGEIVIITEGTAARQIIGLLSDSGPILAEFEPFVQVFSSQSPDQLARAYLNGPAVSQNLIGVLETVFDISSSELGLTLAATGMVSNAHTSIGLSAVDEGFKIRIARLPAPMTGAKATANEVTVDYAANVSADADFFLSGQNLGQSQLVRQIVSSLLFGLSGAPLEMSGIEVEDPIDKAYRELEEQFGIDIRDDLLDQMVGDFYLAAGTRTFSDPAAVDVFLVSEVEDEVAVRRAIERVVDALTVFLGSDSEEVSIGTQTVGPDTVYTVEISDLGAGQSLTASFGVTNQQLFITIGDVLGALAPLVEGTSLADNPGYVEAMRNLPEGEVSTFYLDLNSVLAAIETDARRTGNPTDLPEEIVITDLGQLQAIAGTTTADGELTITEVILLIGP